mmetsp:Transcript_20667/g.36817  ORF Transcript_20667/g.36817 Transcript_20667/m.36817 type:complete len:201 (-) Transcript_20667:73-675(-)
MASSLRPRASVMSRMNSSAFQSLPPTPPPSSGISVGVTAFALSGLLPSGLSGDVGGVVSLMKSLRLAEDDELFTGFDDDEAEAEPLACAGAGASGGGAAARSLDGLLGAIPRSLIGGGLGAGTGIVCGPRSGARSGQCLTAATGSFSGEPVDLRFFLPGSSYRCWSINFPSFLCSQSSLSVAGLEQRFCPIVAARKESEG